MTETPKTETAKPVNKHGRFDYVAYDEEAQNHQAAFKMMFAHLAREVEKFPPGRAQSLIVTKLEEAYMWVGKMVRDHQISRTGKAELQEDRRGKDHYDASAPPSSQL